MQNMLMFYTGIITETFTLIIDIWSQNELKCSYELEL